MRHYLHSPVKVVFGLVLILCSINCAFQLQRVKYERKSVAGVSPGAEGLGLVTLCLLSLTTHLDGNNAGPLMGRVPAVDWYQV